ncbi:DMT family transporter [Gelidibacter sp.]|uniref:EamA family transporter n=1 Tax=Gelidibacter sp. TaxID=2018083 RepID=UPI002CC7A8CF|nr:DMT family transporter [Gelidibacter sp.]HUH29363.1 DMT family transporter [Gelidibacter sp.]
MNAQLKGVLYVAIGATSYGVLATFVKYANNQGIGTAGLAFSQYLFGAFMLSVLVFLFSRRSGAPQPEGRSFHPKIQLMLFGGFSGLTSSFYYLSIQYVPVSVGIILLMQTIWMGVVLEFFTARALVNRTKILGAIVAIIGTLFAAKIFETDLDFNPKGIGFGLLAALSFTGMMYGTSRIGLQLSNLVRSQYLVYGGLIVIVIFWNVQILQEFNWTILITWGVFLGCFGTILPPLLFNKGFPIIGTGLGSIIAALEIPISVFSAYWVLNEEISNLQWLGIVIILFAVLMINFRKK